MTYQNEMIKKNVDLISKSKWNEQEEAFNKLKSSETIG